MEGTKRKLIELLANNKSQSISGQELSKQLNISRSAVWKHMNNLKKEGYVIEAVTNKGYRIIKAPDDLSASTVQWDLHTNWLGQHLVFKETVKSTQLVGHELARENADHGTVIVAREQTEGRGRMSRYWDSKDGLGLWFSSIFRPEYLEPKRASQLTLVAAVAIADYLSKRDLDVKIKWPNDIFINGKKLAGILTEMQAEQDAVQYIVLGIGMNVNHQHDDLHETVQHKATSIYLETNEIQNLNQVLTEILKELENKYEIFMGVGFPVIKEMWEAYAYKIGEWIQVKTKDIWDAKVVGIHDDGALKVIDHLGKQHHLYSAEILWKGEEIE
ncbi:biotin--[acetyl-CoA-carboxylase] ligase [Filobacillus milosensis]|uniref:Bifunctional ligase/repressor BirA n=1 Tax=Filobacillus milosensis TaxID=94137 RepID=A0A4Y8IQQ5_9BACI|nr:biotin--[acetyl-CoA-carboxylase] ligase [Filobacillus milosensis]TFB23984.1 biotin--[acetyl-CoA-carboxylase] ligase [Filobacillus milosensis]